MNFSKINMKEFEYSVHKALYDNTFYDIINKYGINNMLEMKNSGIISNILLYYIGLSDTVMINRIVNSLNIKLMKRDYLNLIKYYYSIDNHSYMNIAIQMFENNILGNVNDKNKATIILPKDLDFIIDNKLYQLLEKMVGLFIETSSKGELCSPLGLEHYYMLPNATNNILYHLESDMTKRIISELNNIFTQINFNIILDVGNILHSRSGKITNTSLNDLLKIIQICRLWIGHPLLIVHQRHIREIPGLLQLIKKNEVVYYATPYNYNDDLFILWFFLKSCTRSFILSNDKYRDHVFKFETSKTAESQIRLSQFYHYLKQQIIRYDIVNNTIDDIPIYSRCIQKIDNKIFIPHVSGKFLQVIL